jgi:ketosteroid isomerase-like protein
MFWAAKPPDNIGLPLAGIQTGSVSMLSPAQTALLAWYEAIRPETLERIDQLYAPQASFKDPFNQVSGQAAIRAIFQHMFDTTVSPRFVMLEKLAEADRLFVTWDFHFQLRGRPYTVHGASLLQFDDQGRVVRHRDYWDPAEELWQKLPLLGRAIAWLRRRFQAVAE